jgi:putative DNA primase/helicase
LNGGNGKGVFLNTIAGIMGDYAVAKQMDTLEVAFGHRHTADLAMLCGARLVTASLTEKGRASVTARFMHKNPFTFIPTFKLTIIGNDMPKLSNVNEAMRRRFNVVPFTQARASRFGSEPEAAPGVAGHTALDVEWLPRLAQEPPRQA